MASASQLPTLSLMLSFTAPHAAQTWVDISTYVRSFATTAGRQHELLTTEPGTLTVTLDNRDGRFSPWNTSSPYASDGNGLVPMIGIRLQATWQSVAYPVFQGYVEKFNPKWANPLSMDMELSCVDELGLLSVSDMNSQAYVNDVLALNPTLFYRCTDPAGNLFLMDSSGTPQNATVFGGTLGQPGAIAVSTDTSLQLTAGNYPTSPAGYIAVTTAQLKQALTGGDPFSFEFWFKAPATSAQVVYLVVLVTPNSSSSTTSALYIELFNGNVEITDFSGTTDICPAPTAINGSWHHLALSFGTGGSSYYLDGALIGSSSTNRIPSTYSQGTLTFGVGSNPQVALSFQEIAVYNNRALTAAQVAQHYSDGGGALNSVQTSGEAIVNGLALLGIPSSIVALTTAGGQVAVGQAQVQPPGGGSLYSASTPQEETVQSTSTSLTGTDGLTYAQTYETAESGFLFVNPAGVLVFYDRHYAVPGTSTPGASSQATYGDTPSSTFWYLLDGFLPALDNLDLWNEVVGSATTITGDNLCTGAEQTYENATSQASYGKRSYPSLDNLAVSTDADALGLVQWIGTLYGTPIPRVAAIRLTSTVVTVNTLGQMLGRGLWDQVTVVYQGLTGGTAFTQNALIEGIDHAVDYEKEEWITTFHLSPAEASARYLILDSSTYGAINSNNALAY